MFVISELTLIIRTIRTTRYVVIQNGGLIKDSVTL